LVFVTKYRHPPGPHGGDHAGGLMLLFLVNWWLG
jgi:hypothetical protein